MAPVPTTVSVTPDTVVFTALGQTEQIAAEVRDQIGRVMVGVAVSWSSDTLVGGGGTGDSRGQRSGRSGTGLTVAQEVGTVTARGFTVEAGCALDRRERPAEASSDTRVARRFRP